MPRANRKKSAFGIYHVMLRGINKQDIFFNEDDFMRMLNILHDIPFTKNKATGVVTSDRCTIYAFCILHNHLHILIKEGTLKIANIMKIIELSYVMYYNKKYQRIGHLFQGRFESEPVNDYGYFHVLLRYIAQNPVKAQESPSAEVYPYSSWNEYVGHKSNVMKVLKQSAIEETLEMFSLEELKEWISKDNNDNCLDIDDFTTVMSDTDAWNILSGITGITNPEDFRALDPQTQIYHLLQAIEQGVNFAQAARLGTLSRFQITNAHRKKFGESLTSGSDPNVSQNLENNTNENTDEIQKIHEKVKRIKGQGKQTYHRLHLIVTYLYEHPDAKCQEIAEQLSVSGESVRKGLILLANENIVEIIGKGKNRVYRLK